jgi:hypothetical protein
MKGIAKPLLAARMAEIIERCETDALLSLMTQIFKQMLMLLPVVEVFHRLLERNRDQQTDDDGCDVARAAAGRENCGN